jgi:cellulase/cellobiase CelA1
VSVTTLPGGGGPGPSSSCRVAYTISPWGGAAGFTAGLTLTNTGSAALSGWTLTFTLPGGQRITPPGWSATWAQSGQAVTATPLSWNATLAPGASTSIGFNGAHTGDTAEPAAFSVNGASCTVA